MFPVVSNKSALVLGFASSAVFRLIETTFLEISLDDSKNLEGDTRTSSSS